MKFSHAILSIISFVILNIFHTPCNADMYKWRDAEGVLHFSDVQPNQNEHFERISAPKSPTSDIEIQQVGIVIKDIKMAWYLSQSSFQKEKIYHPQIEFAVQNNSDVSISGLKAKCIFIENNNKVFGTADEYIDETPPGLTSKTIFIYPAMGIVYNGYNRSTIINKTFDVQMKITLNDETIFKNEFVFSSSTTK